MLEPRRLAARAAAARMAATLGEAVGATVGYRVRFGSKISRATRIEVVTEGIFTRLVLEDPALDGVAAVLFDEFHERSLDADLGLALARDVQQGLREDLKLLVMSATLDGARVGRLLGEAAVIESAGRAFPVETRYVGRDARIPIERQVAETVVRALRADAGSLLVFLPGAAEIRRAETLLRERAADPAIDIVALYGALEADLQDRAIAPAPPGRRKVVLATSIAETSLTIEGVRVVIDCGLARVPRYEPDVGLTRLETVRVSRASADQRRGRAGRIEPGVCYRLWDEPQTASLEPANRPEILAADLSGFVLDLAHWGVADPSALAFLDPPPAAALAEARALLDELGAIDRGGRITEEGRRLRNLPLPPRLARMVVDAAAAGDAELAAEIALVLTERGLGGNDVDLDHRLDALRRDRSRRAQDARAMAKRWAEMCQVEGRRERSEASVASVSLLALAYPDRIAKNRGAGGAFLLANGRGANVDPTSALSRATVPRRRRNHRNSRPGPHRAGGAADARRDRSAIFRPHREPRRDRVRRCEREPARAPLAPPRCDHARRADDEGGTERCDRANACRGHRAARHGAAAVDPVAAAVARPGHVPAPRGRRRVARPVRRRAFGDRHRLACAGAGRQDGARRARRRRPRGDAARIAAVEAAPPARSRGSHSFHRALRARRCRSSTRRRRDPSLRSGCRSCSASTAIPRLPQDRCRWWSSCCRRRIGRCR